MRTCTRLCIIIGMHMFRNSWSRFMWIFVNWMWCLKTLWSLLHSSIFKICTCDVSWRTYDVRSLKAQCSVTWISRWGLAVSAGSFLWMFSFVCLFCDRVKGLEIPWKSHCSKPLMNGNIISNSWLRKCARNICSRLPIIKKEGKPLFHCTLQGAWETHR